jgi:hypothetical protein
MNTQILNGSKSQIQVTIEARSPDLSLQRCVNRLHTVNPKTREDSAHIIRSMGFECHVGGHHVAIIKGKVRFALVTHPTAPDFN